MSRFLSQGSLYRPAFFEAVLYHSVANAKLPAPLGHCLRLVSEFDKHVSGFVVHLLKASCPSAVIGAVIAVVVYAVNRVKEGWPSSHVFKKAAEVVPSLAHCYPTTTVAMEKPIQSVGATLQHVRPGGVFCRHAHFVRGFAASNSRGCGPLQASARFYVARLKGISTHCGYSPALAKARPAGAMIHVGKTKNIKPFVIVTPAVNNLSHGITSQVTSQNKSLADLCETGFSGISLASSAKYIETGDASHV